MAATILTTAHSDYFETLGYLHLPGYLSEEFPWIEREFEAAWAASGVAHDGSRRTIFPGPFVAATPQLATLIEHPKIVAVCTALLGAGYGLQGGDGNFYSGDTGWHSDAYGPWPEKTTARHLKLAIYLDPLTRDTGALRVIPGSHRQGIPTADGQEREEPSWKPSRALETGMAGQEVPCVALETRPGDLVCFDHRIKHAAFGGGTRRRMFATNWIQGAHTPAMHQAILNNYRFYRDHEGVDWNALSGDWIDHPPAAREPMLRQLREFSRLVMTEQRPQAQAVAV